MSPSSGPGIHRLLIGRFGRATVNRVDTTIAPHCHGEINLVFNLGDTTASFTVWNRHAAVIAGAGILVGPWVLHAKNPSLEASSDLLSLVLDSRWIEDNRRGTFELARWHNRIGIVPVTGGLSESLRALHEMIVSPNASPTHLACDLVLKIAATAIEDIAQSHGNGEMHGNALDNRLAKALEAFNATAPADINIEKMASEVGLSRSRFYQLFKNGVGVSPLVYIDWLRLRQATDVLTYTTTPIARISDQLGFSASSHFSRFFSQHLGISPASFRKHAFVIDYPGAGAHSALRPRGVTSQLVPRPGQPCLTPPGSFRLR
ncbi:MAG: transcriptional regulator [Ramlibacter sp.]|nr:transcriptional regulator [Ramlibacter sp.]